MNHHSRMWPSARPATYSSPIWAQKQPIQTKTMAPSISDSGPTSPKTPARVRTAGRTTTAHQA